MIEISLPFPDMKLTHNSRVNWRAKMARVAAARELGFWMTKSEIETTPTIELESFRERGNLAMILEFYPPDNRLRDLTNLEEAMKSYLDGVMDALDLNDRDVIVTMAGRCELVKGGRTTMRLYSIGAEKPKFLHAVSRLLERNMEHE